MQVRLGGIPSSPIRKTVGWKTTPIRPQDHRNVAGLPPHVNQLQDEIWSNCGTLYLRHSAAKAGEAQLNNVEFYFIELIFMCSGEFVCFAAALDYRWIAVDKCDYLPLEKSVR